MKYSNPPLLYVKTKVWWHIDNPNTFEKSKLISGILYPLLKDSFNQIKNFNNSFFNGITFTDDKEQVVIEISQSEFSLVSTDENYSWEKFRKILFKNNRLLLTELNELITPNHVHTQLEYCDFFKVDPDKIDIITYLNDFLKVDVKNQTLNRLDDFAFAFIEKYDSGKLKIHYSIGQNQDGVKGIIVRFTFDSDVINPDNKLISDWFESSHSICKDSFEKTIEGKLIKTII